MLAYKLKQNFITYYQFIPRSVITVHIYFAPYTAILLFV